MKKRPLHPGVYLKTECVDKKKVTAQAVSEALRYSPTFVGLLMRGERNVTARTALRLAKYTCTTPEFWLDMQRKVDLWEAREEEKYCRRRQDNI